MTDGFRDHPRKKTVRKMWDTPVLRYLHRRWGEKYLYLGLPGPAAHDIKLWADMISRVLACELLDDRSRRGRRDIEELDRQLTLLGIDHTVFVGPLEELLVRGEDYDGKRLNANRFITLFNFDFCGPITQKITTRVGRKCLRFEALRQIAILQRTLYRQHISSSFVLLVTVNQKCSAAPLRQFVAEDDLPPAVAKFLSHVTSAYPLPACGYVKNTGVLKAFIFNMLRAYFRSHNIVTVFLPPVVYVGMTSRSPMIHFAVVCHMERPDAPFADDPQTAEQFLAMSVLKATDDSIEPCGDVVLGIREVTDPLSVLHEFEDAAEDTD